MSEIAKYKKEGFPDEWFLTDFTMRQVERRIANLELHYAALLVRHNALLKAVATLRNLECGVPEMGMLGAHKIIIETARAEVDRLIGEANDNGIY